MTVEYYTEAIRSWRKGDEARSMFYFGAALHLIQDMTVPQHVNIRLLDDHRQYENYVRRTFESVKTFRAESGAYVLSTIEFYIKFNARIALKIHKRFKKIENDEIRFYRITKCTLPLAERTTAGAMVLFYNKIHS